MNSPQVSNLALSDQPALAAPVEPPLAPSADVPAANDGVITAAAPGDAAVLQDAAIEAGQAGEAGEAGMPPAAVARDVSNAEFAAAVFLNTVPEGASAAVCTKAGDPTTGSWIAQRADSAASKLSADANNYLNCSSFYPGDDGSFKARKATFAACHFLLLDDIGGKVPLDRLAGIALSWLVMTSPGNYQGALILADPITNADAATRLLEAIIAAGLCDRGATGPVTRWARLPNAINGKPKYRSESGEPFRCERVEWHPERRYTVDEIVERLGLTLAPAGRPKKAAPVNSTESRDCNAGVWTPKEAENPVITALKARGLYKRALGGGAHDVTCPWAEEHTDQVDNGTAYFEPDAQYPKGGFKCHHSHGEQYRLEQLLARLDVTAAQAANRAQIHVVTGQLSAVVDAAERALATLGRHFQCGGLIVQIETDPSSGDTTIVPTSANSLTLALSWAATFTMRDKQGNVSEIDPPARHVMTLFGAQSFRHLRPLEGLARQPYFAESDGELVIESGYCERTRRFGVFDPREFVLGDPTESAAREALAELLYLLAEFRFENEYDMAAALAAIFTAVARPTLPQAPAFHITAPSMGSGKSYLCELIGAFSSPGPNAKVSYPTTSDEATKVLLSLLLASPGVIEFDDMTTDWIAHGIINRCLTAQWLTERLLGYSKTATVSTRTLFLGSGNNVEPSGDLRRRVLTIRLDTGDATPATLAYKGSPLKSVREQRGRFVCLVLTIIAAWKKAGCPRTDVKPVASYGVWTDYCRHPLMWLGLPDPATSMLEQVKHDPGAEPILDLVLAWYEAFGSTPTTVRTALSDGDYAHPDLYDALHALDLIEHGKVNRSKLGKLLKRYDRKIVFGHRFERMDSAERTRWRVVKVDEASPASPPSPPSPDTGSEDAGELPF